jgi:hypothetical protein
MLPAIKTPSAELILPVSGAKVRVKAFTVAENKNFIIASETGDKSDILFLVKELLKESVVEGSPDIESYSAPDVIAIFLKCAEISKGKDMILRYRCNNNLASGEGGKCGSIIEVIADLSDYEIERKGDPSADPSKPIELFDGISIKLHYPTLGDAREVAEKKLSPAESIVWTLAKCADAVYDGEEMYSDFTEEEIYDWWMKFPASALSKVEKFFESAPTIKKSVKIKCDRCGYETSVELEALEDFFDSGILESVI